MPAKRETSSSLGIRLILLIGIGASVVAAGCSMKSPMNGLFKAATSDDTGESVWMESLDEAKQISATTGMPILADFTGTDWCVWCQRMREEIFDQPEFLEWAEENVVLLEVDFPRHGRQSPELKSQNAELKERFSIVSYPTVVLMDSAGNELGRTGYVKGGPAAWIGVAESRMK